MQDSNENVIIIALSELTNKIETLIDKQEELAENISKIKEAVYNPDQGLYARLKDLDARIEHIERWKNMNVRLMWVVGASIAGLLVKAAWGALF